MRHIKILGTGCAKCQQAETVVKKMVFDNHIEATIEKIEDIEAILYYNLLSTPAIVVDEVVKIKGKVPSETEILEALK